MYVTTLNHTSSTSTSLYIAFYITARLTLFDKYITILYATSHRETYCICASSYCILCHCPSSTCFYKYITVLYSSVLGLTSSTNTSHTALYTTPLGRTTTSKSLYYTHSPVSHLHVTWDHWVTAYRISAICTIFKVSLTGNIGQGDGGAVLIASHRRALTEPLPALAKITWSEKLSHFSVDPHQICHACHHPDPLPGL